MKLTFTMKALALLLLPLTAQAEPFCNELMNKGALPKKYQKLAPVYSSSENGWIFTEKMLRHDYEMKSEATDLMKRLISNLNSQNIKLALIVAPPRSIIAGQNVVDQTAGVGVFDAAQAKSSFDKLISQLNSLGAIAPNLASAALQNEGTRSSFYFKRDTHWTAMGAAISAQALASELGLEVSAAPETATTLEEEKGSLAEIVRKTCNESPAKEEFAIPNYRKREGDLFGETTAETYLLGTSFSNRYKKDFYRAGEAFSHALNQDVVNLSQAGTGMVGIFESFVLSGQLDSGPELLIWETPYSESFNATSKLRQLLGALQFMHQKDYSKSVQAKANAQLKINEQPDFFTIETKTNEPVKATAIVNFEDGSSKKLKLRRLERVPNEVRSPVIAVSLSGFKKQIKSIEVEIDDESAVVQIFTPLSKSDS